MNKTKYGNIKTGKYASKKEACIAGELKIRERIGEISNLREQVKFELTPNMKCDDGTTECASSYIADFVYEEGGKVVVVDVKGVRTPLYILKRKLMLMLHGVSIVEV